jgi:hypothetical protein
MYPRPPFNGGLGTFGAGLVKSGPHSYDRLVRPATAIVILILLAIIAVAGIIQLWLIYSPPS